MGIVDNLQHVITSQQSTIIIITQIQYNIIRYYMISQLDMHIWICLRPRDAWNILYSSCMTLTLCFCLLPWYNPFNDHMTQYDLDVASICLVFWCDFMWIIYQTSFWKLDHRVDTTETSMMKPTFQSRWAETHGIEYLQGGQQKPGSWSWLLGDFWNFQFQDSMKWSWRFLINIYIYIMFF